MPPNKKSGKVWLDEIGYLRGIAAIAVVAIHVSGYFTEIKAPSYWFSTIVFINRAVSFAVPCFVIMMTMLLFRKYSNRFHSISQIGSFYRKRFITILPGYFLYSIVYQYYMYLNGNPVTLKSFSLNITYGTSFYHLWFFLLLFEIYLFFPVIAFVFNKNKNHFFTSFIISFSSGFLYRRLLVNSAFVNFDKILPLSSFFDYSVYIILGIYLSLNYQKVQDYLVKTKYRIIIFAVTILLIVVTWPILMPLKEGIYFYKMPANYLLIPKLLTPFYNLAIIALLLKVCCAIKRNSLISKTLNYFGQISFNLYLVHALVFSLLVVYLAKNFITENRFIFYPVSFTLTIIGSVFLIEASKFFAHRISFISVTILRLIRRKQLVSNRR